VLAMSLGDKEIIDNKETRKIYNLLLSYSSIGVMLCSESDHN
jgi:hypothetical protein